MKTIPAVSACFLMLFFLTCCGSVNTPTDHAPNTPADELSSFVTATLPASPAPAASPVTELFLPELALAPTSLSSEQCGPPADWVGYTIQPGDNLFRLSQKLGVTITELQLANCLGNSILIQAGDKLYVPFVPARPESTITPLLLQLPEEAILIQQPASGSRVTSPVTVAGLADPSFEQTLVVRILLDDGTQIALRHTLIQADIGQRGPFEVELEIAVTGERQAFIQVFSLSPRDGGITHLSSVGITLTGTGQAEIRMAEPRSEQIHILRPSSGELIAGGVILVEGYAWAGFENTLVIEVQDQDGNVIGQVPVTIQSTEMGQPGPFRATIPYVIADEGPARIVVRDISPAFGGDTHLSSVEIQLAP
jgi:LysM repeat protein